MQRPPTSIDATKVNTLRPDPDPATRPSRRTVSSTIASKPSLVHHRARQQQPPISHQTRVVEHRLQPIDPTRYAPSQEVPPLVARMTVVLDSILPCQEAFLVDAPTPEASPHRWIQAKRPRG